MPRLRLSPDVYPITAETRSPEAFIGSDDVELLLGRASWGDGAWRGGEIGELRRALEQRRVVAAAEKEMSLSETDTPLAEIVERILVVVREVERVSHAYYLRYSGD